MSYFYHNWCRRNETRHVRPYRSKASQQSPHRFLFGSVNLLRESRRVSAGRGAVGLLRLKLKHLKTPTKAHHSDTTVVHVSESRSSGVLESSSFVGFRVIDEPHVLQEAAPAKFRTLQGAVEEALKLGIGPDCMFNLARALKAFEQRTETKLPGNEYSGLLRLWWSKAHLPESAEFGEYLDLLILGYETAKSPLGSHVLKQLAESIPLPKEPSYEQRISRLLAVCRGLAAYSADGTFFLGRRDAGELLGNSNPHFANNVMRVLIVKGALIEVEKGTRQGRRATRYRLSA